MTLLLYGLRLIHFEQSQHCKLSWRLNGSYRFSLLLPYPKYRSIRNLSPGLQAETSVIGNDGLGSTEKIGWRSELENARCSNFYLSVSLTVQESQVSIY